MNLPRPKTHRSKLTAAALLTAITANTTIATTIDGTPRITNWVQNTPPNSDFLNTNHWTNGTPNAQTQYRTGHITNGSAQLLSGNTAIHGLRLYENATLNHIGGELNVTIPYESYNRYSASYFKPNYGLLLQGDNATYNLIGGTLNAATTIVGQNSIRLYFSQNSTPTGQGTFNQIGGTNNTDTLEINNYRGSSSGEDLGILVPGILGDEAYFGATGTTTQSIPSTSIQPIDPTKQAIYNLQGGTLNTNTLNIQGSNGQAILNQTGGTHNAGYITVSGTNFPINPNEKNAYNYLAGQLNVQHGINLNNRGTFNFGNQNKTLNYTQGIFNFANGNLKNAQNIDLNLGQNALIILSQDQAANTNFKSITSQNAVHILGTDLTINQNQSIIGSGIIQDFINISGSLTASQNTNLHITKGMHLSGNANVNLKNNTLISNDIRSGIEAGSLNAKYLSVNAAKDLLLNPIPPIHPKTTFTQKGGIVTISQATAIRKGNYQLNGGILDSKNITIGGNTTDFDTVDPFHYRSLPSPTSFIFPTSNLNQAGGIINTTNLRVADGQYNISGGTINAKNIDVRENPIQFITLGTLHTLQTQTSQAPPQRINTTQINQTGGTINVQETLNISGQYNFTAGTINTKNLTLANAVAYRQQSELNILSQAANINISGDLTLTQHAKFTAAQGATIHFSGSKIDIQTADIRTISPWLISTPNYTLETPTSIVWEENSNTSITNHTVFNPPIIQFEIIENQHALDGLANLTLIIENGTDETATLEVISQDLGNLDTAYNENFSLGTLQIGSDLTDAFLTLVDKHNNSDVLLIPAIPSAEAIYVDTLNITAGSTLDLAGLNLYYKTANIADGATILNGAAIQAIPEPASLLLLTLGLITLNTRKQNKA